jgi:hypothetical protein
MGRRVITTRYQATAGGGNVDTYFDRVIKYIPSDIVSAWVLANSLINSSQDDVPKAMILWIAFGCGVALTAVWTWKQTEVPGKRPAYTQILISTVAFVVWVFAVGGPFVHLTFYRPVYGSLLLVLYTLVVALIVPAEHATVAQSSQGSTGTAS